MSKNKRKSDKAQIITDWGDSMLNRFSARSRKARKRLASKQRRQNEAESLREDES